MLTAKSLLSLLAIVSLFFHVGITQPTPADETPSAVPTVSIDPSEPIPSGIGLLSGNLGDLNDGNLDDDDEDWNYDDYDDYDDDDDNDDDLVSLARRPHGGRHRGPRYGYCSISGFCTVERPHEECHCTKAGAQCTCGDMWA
ncbi:hypothetical protein FE257_010859 [Aspergillus nanangensis]|uniref:Uncharacterized protein n=1 Tax=Aspergillus nanangensis TaxID=2582783 RepID=A0AAD4GY23_ASPNN|nr:hypothetical protein FE257_010859 [Aspergillus nanangensis]